MCHTGNKFSSSLSPRFLFIAQVDYLSRKISVATEVRVQGL